MSSYELCAGLLDRPNRSKEQAVCDEIKEELGYVVKPEDLEFVGRSSSSAACSFPSSRCCRHVRFSHVHVLRGSHSGSEEVSRRWFERGRGANFRIPRPSFRNGCFSRRLRPRKVGFDYDGNVLVASFTRKKLSCGQTNKMACLLETLPFLPFHIFHHNKNVFTMVFTTQNKTILSSNKQCDTFVRKYHSLANERLPPARYPPASEFAPAFAL